jgi:hypothetical protein
MDMTASDPTGAWERWRARTPELRRKLIGSFQQGIAERGQTRVVLGLSGGLDSTVAAYLFVEALGAANVFGVMLPYRTSDPLSLSSAQGIVNGLGITSRRVNISPMVDAYFANFPDASRERRATRLAWERLSILHDFGAHYGGQVLQIVNRSDLALDFGPEPRLPGWRTARSRGCTSRRSACSGASSRSRRRCSNGVRRSTPIPASPTSRSWARLRIDRRGADLAARSEGHEGAGGRKGIVFRAARPGVRAARTPRRRGRRGRDRLIARGSALEPGTLYLVATRSATSGT